MKVNILCVSALMLSVISLCAAVDDGIKFQLPAIQNFADESGAKVKPTGLVQRIPSGGSSVESGQSAGNSADMVTDRDFEWIWKPSPLTSHATGGADLTDSDISPDASAVVMVERVGGADAPNSSRLVFVSLKSGKVVRVVELPERLISSVKWLKGNRLLLLQEAQAELGSPRLFAVFSLEKMKITSESRSINGKVTSWACGNGKVFYIIEGTGAFSVLPVGGISGVPVEVRTRSGAGNLLWLKRSKLLALYGGETIEYYQLADNKGYFLRSKAALPAGFLPRAAVETGGNGDMALLSSDAKAAIITGGVFRNLAGRTGDLLCYSPAASTLLVEQQRFNGFLPCRMPDGVCGKAIVPGKIKPMNRNRNFRIFALNEKHPAVILIDHRANIYRIDMKSKRPVKQLITETDRTGFR